MQAILVFLAAVAIIGSVGYRESDQVPKGVLLVASTLLAISLYSLRIV